MVTIYRRHEQRCHYSNTEKFPNPRRNTDCTCPIHTDGFYTANDGVKHTLRISLDTRNFREAEKRLKNELRRQIEGSDPKKPLLTVKEAADRFLRDKRTALRPPDEIQVSDAVLRFREQHGVREPEPEGVRKYRDILKPLTEFCNEREIVFLSDVTTDLLTDFRETWKGRYDPSTKTHKPKTQIGKMRYQESVEVFFRHALTKKWITEDPAAT